MIRYLDGEIPIYPWSFDMELLWIFLGNAYVVLRC